MQNEDINTFTQKDLMQHLLQASQHAATREELQAVKQELIADSDKRFGQVDKRFEQIERRFEELRGEIREQGKRHDHLLWALFAGMLAIFFKDHLAKLFT
jgi:tetrahydromethanopterin S-methyltransferase subunit G